MKYKLINYFFPNKNTKKRLYSLDNIRGITVLNMIVFHALWDAVNLCGFSIPWFEGIVGEAWQFLICSSFIIISGLCINLSSHPYKKGLTVFFAGLVITLVTFIFVPDEIVVFGILTFLGIAMIFTAFLKKFIDRLTPLFILLVCLLLFVFTKGINEGYLGIINYPLIMLPEKLYKGLILTFLGFTDESFHSSDYFSFFPWIFLFIGGYSFGKIIKIDSFPKRKIHNKSVINKRIPILTFIGQRALLIYLMHQPLLYLAVLLIRIK